MLRCLNELQQHLHLKLQEKKKKKTKTLYKLDESECIFSVFCKDSALSVHIPEQSKTTELSTSSFLPAWSLHFLELLVWLLIRNLSIFPTGNTYFQAQFL